MVLSLLSTHSFIIIQLFLLQEALQDLVNYLSHILTFMSLQFTWDRKARLQPAFPTSALSLSLKIHPPCLGHLKSPQDLTHRRPSEAFARSFSDRGQGTRLAYSIHLLGLREGVDSCLKGVPSSTTSTALVGFQEKQEHCFPRGLEHLMLNCPSLCRKGNRREERHNWVPGQ